MKVQTRYFGEVEIQDEKVITFEEGLPGFEDFKKFAVLDTEKGTFNYLQCIEDKNVCFVVTDPYEFKEDYAPHISEGYFEKLGGGDSKEFIIWVIACLKEDMAKSTINLAGPLLINLNTKKAIQVIIEDKKYKSRHTLEELLEEE